MFVTNARMVIGDHMGGLTFRPQAESSKHQRLLASHRHPYRTQDGYVCVVIYTDSHWRAFLALLGKEDLFDTDPRFSDLSQRTSHVAELYTLVAKVIEKGRPPNGSGC